jgi:hypothetical protein
MGLLLGNICLEKEKWGAGIGVASAGSPVRGLFRFGLAPPPLCQAKPYQTTSPKKAACLTGRKSPGSESYLQS